MGRNPAELSCFVTCSACWRCADRGRYAACASCSGHYDPLQRWEPDPDDFCDCRNGILRYKTQKGRRIVAKFPGNPFGGKVRADQETTDEREWQQFLQGAREKLDDQHWDPIQFTDGSSTDAWLKEHRKGKW